MAGSPSFDRCRAALLAALALPALALPAMASAAEPDPDAVAGHGPTMALGAVYTGERWSVVDGGVATGGAYVDNLDLTAELDGERVFGVEGLTLFGYVLYNNGRELAEPYAGAAQGISNIEAVRAWRLYEAWADWSAGSGSLRFGLYNLNSEFDVNETGALFLNPAHGIGTEVAQSGRNGPSIFPITSLGVRYRHEFGEWYGQVVALDGVPGDPEDPSSNRVDLGGEDGALLVGELGRAFAGGRVLVGVWHYTAEFDDVRDVDAGGAPVSRDGTSGAYALVEGRVLSETDGEQGLSAFLRFGVADERVHQFGSYLGAGLVYTGALPGRPADQLGLAFASSANGDRFREAMTLAGAPVERRETIWELAYRMQFGENFYVQPDVQYVANPGTDPALDDAWVVGVRFQAAWSWDR